MCLFSNLPKVLQIVTVSVLLNSFCLALPTFFLILQVTLECRKAALILSWVFGIGASLPFLTGGAGTRKVKVPLQKAECQGMPARSSLHLRTSYLPWRLGCRPRALTPGWEVWTWKDYVSLKSQHPPVRPLLSEEHEQYFGNHFLYVLSTLLYRDSKGRPGNTSFFPLRWDGLACCWVLPRYTLGSSPHATGHTLCWAQKAFREDTW